MSPRRWRVRNPVPQATSSVRAGGSSAIARARDRIDLRTHDGAHPRIGAADVVPIVAIDPADASRARATAATLAERIGAELGLPVFLYGELATDRGPAYFRRGGPAELQ